MERSLEAIKAAIRVLSAINDKQHPTENDVEALAAFAGHPPEHQDVDEFACEIIQGALRRRAAFEAHVGKLTRNREVNTISRQPHPHPPNPDPFPFPEPAEPGPPDVPSPHPDPVPPPPGSPLPA